MKGSVGATRLGLVFGGAVVVGVVDEDDGDGGASGGSDWGIGVTAPGELGSLAFSGEFVVSAIDRELQITRCNKAYGALCCALVY